MGRCGHGRSRPGRGGAGISIAQEIGIDGRSKMTKPELIDALRNH